MEEHVTELYKVFIKKTIPDDRLKRQVFIESIGEPTPVSNFDICMMVVLIIDNFIRSIPEELQNEEEGYILKNLPLLLANRHRITV